MLFLATSGSFVPLEKYGNARQRGQALEIYAGVWQGACVGGMVKQKFREDGHQFQRNVLAWTSVLSACVTTALWHQLERVRGELPEALRIELSGQGPGARIVVGAIKIE